MRAAAPGSVARVLDRQGRADHVALPFHHPLEWSDSPCKAAWPIIVLFFSVIGVALYVLSCRPRHIGSIRNRAGEEEARRAHREFTADTWKKVVGSDIHCVAGDGLGIVSAMIVMRLLGSPFWTEFWTEYAVGFVFGWFLFQAPAMHHMGMPWPTAIWKGGRAEFFSMMTVMVGMGLVMRFLTPIVVGAPPKPATAAFWGIAALGLLVGFIFTYPLNWLLVAQSVGSTGWPDDAVARR
jgi:Na+/melibiose symporter-like transporter